MPRSTRTVLSQLLLASLLLSAGCGGATGVRAPEERPPGIRVAAFDFAESELLAELYLAAIESAGLPVVRLGVVGPREVVGPALELDRIDLVPEYLGAALRFAGSESTDADPMSARDELNELLIGRGLIALEPSPAQDTNVVVITVETAERESITTISDLTRLAEDLRFGGPAECGVRPQCLPGLESVYGLRFAEFVPQPSLAFTAEALRRGEIEVGLMFSTAAELDTTELLALVDDRGLQPAENIVPVVRLEALDRWGPDVATAVEAVSRELTTEELQALNVRVAEGEAVGDVARSWLAAHDLLHAE